MCKPTENAMDENSNDTKTPYITIHTHLPLADLR